MPDADHHHRFIGNHCSCGQPRPTNVSIETAVADGVEQGLLHGLFPEPMLRRELLRTVGASAIIGALSSILPLDALKAIAQERKPLEKTKLAVGFLPITCAVPLIYGEKLGSYSKEGLEVSLQKIAGIALIRDKMLNGELDVSQQVMPVALTMSAGLGGNVQSIKVLTILNQNGNSLVLANKHKDNRNPKNWKGFVFAVPFEQSHQTLQLRNYLAAAGLDPDQDVTVSYRSPHRIRGEPPRREHRRVLRWRARRSAGCLRGGGIHPSNLEGDMGRPSVLLGDGRRKLDPAESEHLHGVLPRHYRSQSPCLEAGKPSRYGEGAVGAAVSQRS